MCWLLLIVVSLFALFQWLMAGLYKGAWRWSEARRLTLLKTGLEVDHRRCSMWLILFLLLATPAFAQDPWTLDEDPFAKGRDEALRPYLGQKPGWVAPGQPPGWSAPWKCPGCPAPFMRPGWAGIAKPPGYAGPNQPPGYKEGVDPRGLLEPRGWWGEK